MTTPTKISLTGLLRRLLVLTLIAVAVTPGRAGTAAESSAGETVPEELTPAEWAGIREAHEAWKHRFAESDDGTTFSASNPGQQWRTVFDGRGFTAEPRGHTWRWGLELKGYGIGETRSAVAGKAKPTATGKRLVYRWDSHENLEEWFLNDKRGLEQGWTFQARPAGPEDEKLRLDLAVRGDLRPVIADEGSRVRFVSEAGEAALTYGGLKAWDATGRPLPARFVSGGDDRRIAVEVDERGATYPVTIDPIAHQAYLKASNTGSGDEFGGSVAVSGDTVVVGAPNEGSSTTGVNSVSNELAPAAGAAYVFTRSGGIWSQQAYLKAFNSGTFDRFGQSVAVSGDTVIVGAAGENSSTMGVNGVPNELASAAGAAYVFTRSAGVWSQQAFLKAHNTGASDQFGWSVAAFGDTVVVGANQEDSNTTGINTVPNDLANAAGAAYVFVRSADVWSQQAYFKASNTEAGDQFGVSVATSGETVVIGAPNEDSSTTGVNSNPDELASDAGAAYVFTRSAGVWSQQAYLKAFNTGADDHFGRSVAVSGDIAVVGALEEDSSSTGVNSVPNEGASGAGAAYVFARNAGIWSQQAYLKPFNTGANDKFGSSVSVSGGTVVVGAYWEDSGTTGVNSVPDELASASGAAYVFTRSGSVWSQQAFLKASNTGASDRFGESVAVSGDTVVVGAYWENSSTTGVNSVPDDLASTAGAAYVFMMSTPSPPPSPPTLDLSGKKKRTTSKSRYTLKGTAVDADGDLVRVEARDTRSSGRKKYRSANGTDRWKYKARLKNGRNTVKIRAVDAAGLMSRVTRVKIIRR